MKKIICLGMIVTFVFFGCSISQKQYAVFNYEDFGPQAMAWQKIGMQWWQWDNHGDSDPNYKYDIKVVAYKTMPLDQIKALFPVSKTEKKDFRYFDFHDAIGYLDKQISGLEKVPEVWAVSLRKRLLQTKKMIQRELN